MAQESVDRAMECRLPQPRRGDEGVLCTCPYMIAGGIQEKSEYYVRKEMFIVVQCSHML